MQTIDIRKLLKDPSLFKEESFINGKWVKSGSGATFPINNPANNDIIAQVANLDAADAEKAIADPFGTSDGSCREIGAKAGGNLTAPVVCFS